MSYCPECGNEVSKTDKRCSKCGYKLMPDDFENFKKNIKTNVDKSHHNIEFVLAIITMVLWVFSVSQSNDYSLMTSGLLSIVLIILIIGVIGAIVTRYYAKPGAITVLIVSLILIIFGISDIFLPIIFSIITLVVAFVLN